MTDQAQDLVIQKEYLEFVLTLVATTVRQLVVYPCLMLMLTRPRVLLKESHAEIVIRVIDVQILKFELTAHVQVGFFNICSE